MKQVGTTMYLLVLVFLHSSLCIAPCVGMCHKLLWPNLRGREGEGTGKDVRAGKKCGEGEEEVDKGGRMEIEG